MLAKHKFLKEENNALTCLPKTNYRRLLFFVRYYSSAYENSLGLCQVCDPLEHEIESKQAPVLFETALYQLRRLVSRPAVMIMQLVGFIRWNSYASANLMYHNS